VQQFNALIAYHKSKLSGHSSSKRTHCHYIPLATALATKHFAKYLISTASKKLFCGLRYFG